MSDLAIMAVNAQQISRAIALAQQLNLPLVEHFSSSYQAYLLVDDNSLSLQVDASMRPTSVNFVSGSLAHRCQYGGGKSQLIARAVGIKTKNYPSILDLTAGLGRDAFVLAHLGCRVTMIERSPIMAALLSDGLARALAAGNESVKHLQLIQQDGKDYLKELATEQKPEVIYLDPMYTASDKSALVKKEMRILRAVVGADLDSAELLSLALEAASKRVVVKRSRLAPYLAELKPSYQLLGKSTRFDVYLR